MGSKSSKTELDNNKDKEIKLKPEFYGSNTYKNNTNYDESFSTSQNTQINQSEEQSTKNNKNEFSSKKYPFKFEYKGNGKSVLLAGSFLDNWANIKVMVKNSKNDIYERVVYLPKGKHQFKFIVDNKWVCSDQYPTMPDERGIINNFIDLTNYIPPENLLKDELIKKLGRNEPEKMNKDNKEINNKNNDYTSTKMPRFNELNMIPPNIIQHYIPRFNLNYQSNQNRIGRKKYLKYTERNLKTENNTYKKILVFPHEKLMHCCPNMNDLDIKENNKSNYFRICTTIRNKHKFLTAVYYKPKNVL
jgi:hypothetical protein